LLICIGRRSGALDDFGEIIDTVFEIFFRSQPHLGSLTISQRFFGVLSRIIGS
jgi:hypothetical protein